MKYNLYISQDMFNNLDLLDEKSFKLSELKSKWDELQNKDVFRYRINNIRERIVDGYLLQLNPNRAIKRRTPEQIDNICQPFDKNKFNFTKASPREILFNFRPQESNEADIHSILVNVSPISQYHSLLCPSINKCLPQIITKESLKLALTIMFLAEDRDLRIGFNSLCALASVNHLHYHLLIEKYTLPVEVVKCNHIKGYLYCLDDDYPVPAFCFEVATEDDIDVASKNIYKLLEYFLKKTIAHNLLITRGQSVLPGDKKEVFRVLIWPRKSSSGVKQLTAFNVAVCELSGWFPVFSTEDFVKLQKDDLENELSKWKLNYFDQLCDKVKILF